MDTTGASALEDYSEYSDRYIAKIDHTHAQGNRNVNKNHTRNIGDNGEKIGGDIGRNIGGNTPVDISGNIGGDISGNFWKGYWWEYLEGILVGIRKGIPYIQKVFTSINFRLFR